MSHSLNLEKLCHECVSIARDAGDAILAIYDAGFNIDYQWQPGKTKPCLLWRKKYNINFYEISNSTLKKVDLDLTGISFSYYIK